MTLPAARKRPLLRTTVLVGTLLAGSLGWLCLRDAARPPTKNERPVPVVEQQSRTDPTAADVSGPLDPDADLGREIFPATSEQVIAAKERLHLLTPDMSDEVVFRTLGLPQALGYESGGMASWLWTHYSLRPDCTMTIARSFTVPRTNALREVRLGKAVRDFGGHTNLSNWPEVSR